MSKTKFAVISAIIAAVAVCSIPFLVVDEKSAQASLPNKVSEKELNDVATRSATKSWEDFEREANESIKLQEEKRRKENEEQLAKSKELFLKMKNKLEENKSRKVRRYRWESPAEARSRLWNVPKEESDEATATALLRVCISEADGKISDCLGIWQVVKTIRSRKCARDWIRRITECDENGETHLSVLRRASKYVLGVVPPRSRRQRWISNLELDCEMPKYWPHSKSSWNKRYKRKRCPRVAKLAKELAAGKTNFDWPINTSARPVTWGGRCESGNGACDDDIACERGLARLYSDTLNAFWCIPGSPRCSDEIDPLCIERGFPSIAERKKEENNLIDK